MDLERGVSNIKLDENPWRSGHDQGSQPWGGPMPGAASGSNPGGWGHMSPQQMRNPWPDGNLAQNVNDALGISGPPGQGGWVPMGTGHGDFNDAAKIWSDPHAEPQQFQSMHNHHRGINGMMDAPGEWGAAGPNQSHQAMWSDPLKAEQDAYWKQQQQQQAGNTWGMPRGGPMGGFHIPPNSHPRGHEGQMGVMMGMRVPAPNGWSAPPGVYRAQAPSDRNIWGRGGGPPRMPGRGYHPSGVDMSVPPPIDMPGDMHMQGVNQMRQMPPPNNMMGGMWKQDPMGGPNGMRSNSYGQSQQVPSPFTMPSKPQAPPGQFPIAGADDLMWHDPNGDLKKWQRDTGVSLWGDPEKSNERPVRLWVVPEGEEEDIEVALSKCPIPQKRNEDGSARLPLSLPTKRPIVVTGWGELPENDPNNPSKQDDGASSKWGDITPVPSNDAPWYLPNQQPAPFAADAPTWGQPPAPGNGSPIMGSMQPGPSENSNFKHIADQLKYAVDKGYLDMSILTLPTLPPHVLQNITSLLTKIPLLESVQNELKTLTESVRPEGELEGSSPVRWMNEVQKVEYNRLIIDVTTANIEVSDLSKKISAGLAEAGMVPMPQDSSRGDAYHYSFLE